MTDIKRIISEYTEEQLNEYERMSPVYVAERRKDLRIEKLEALLAEQEARIKELESELEETTSPNVSV